MHSRKLTAEDAANVPIGVSGLLLIIASVVIFPYFLQRIWPLDELLPGFGVAEQYEFASVAMALLVVNVISRSGGQVFRDVMGHIPNKAATLWLATLIACALFLINFALLFAKAALTLPSDAIQPAFYDGWRFAKVELRPDPFANWSAGEWLTAIVSITLVPLSEELCFRVLLLRRLLSRLTAPFAIAVSALLFGAIHADSNPLYAIGGGLILGYVYWATSSAWLVIAIHALANACSAVVSGTFRIFIKPATQLEENFAFGIGAISLFILIVFVVRRADRQLTIEKTPAAPYGATGGTDHS